jgi:hypothetical protein
LLLLLALAGCLGDSAPPTGGGPVVGPGKTPPFGGTIFLDPDIITEADPTTFQTLTPKGQGVRTMFDRRFGWVQRDAFLFDATFSDGFTVEFQVNPEFGTTSAQSQAEKYAPAIGRLPKSLRTDVKTVWIHDGVQPFGGGNNNLLIHAGQGDLYIASGILEETFVHEAAHTSLDAAHAASAGWVAAQAADNHFISTYARDNPAREDIAESVVVWLAVRFRSARISASLANTIAQTIPNRLTYFDALLLQMAPIQ